MNAASAAAPLSLDDLAIGEILMALKRDPVVHQASYRSKVDLTVATPDSVVFDGVHYSTVSPVASALYALPPPAQSPPERAKRYGPLIQLRDLRKHFNMPIAAVARKFGICATLLKKICRRLGIQRWPHRQIRSLQKSIDMLRESLAVAKGSNKDYIAKKIAAFEYTLQCIMKDPNTAAKGISSGRLASPAAEELAKRAKRAKETQSPPAVALTEEEEEGGGATSEADEGAWSPRNELPVEDRKGGMSLASILC